jgi:hypothetical protein
MEGARQTALALLERVNRFDATIVVAHSQGNLLAHLAYAALVADIGDAASGRLRIVNVANTAEVSANDLVVTHESDVALRLLTQLPGAFALTSPWRETPSCQPPALCPFRLGPPSLGAASGYGDTARHSFLDTYLSDYTVAIADARGVPFTEGRTAFVDRLVDVVYAAAESLRPWAGIEAPAIAPGGHPAAVGAMAGATATFVVAATGSAPLRYQWRRNGVDIPCSAPDACARLDWPVDVDDDGARFDVVVSNARGSVTSQAATLAVRTASVPDLAVASLSFGPASVRPMGTVDVSLTVINQDAGDASASTAVVRINASSTSSANPVVSLNVPVPALAGGAGATLPLLTIAAPATPGVYRLWVVLDNGRTSGQPVDAEANDIVIAQGTLTVMTPALGGPDLVIQSLSHGLLNGPVPPAGKLPVTFIVSNTGADTAAASSATVRISSSSSTPGSTDLVVLDVPALAPGASVARSAVVPTPGTPGTYRVWALADTTGTAGQVGAARDNDAVLAAQALDISDGNPDAADLVATGLSFAPGQLTRGGLLVAGFTVRNQGVAASSASRAVVRLDPVGATAPGIVLTSVTVPELLPGSGIGTSRAFNVAVPVDVSAATYRVVVEVDTGGDAGQATTAAFANDTVAAGTELTVTNRIVPPGATAEGAYGGAISGATATAFRLLVLEDGSFWALYGVPSGGSLRVLGFLQGTGRSDNGSFTSSDLRDFGFAPAASGSASTTYDAQTGAISGTATTTRGMASLTGGPLTDVAYEYHQAARLADVQGAWVLSTNTGDTIAADVQPDGRFDTTSNGGCRLGGTITPRASGKNVFDVEVSFGAAPCALPGQTARGIAVVNTERNGSRQLTLGVVNASRSLGLTAAGYR